MITIPNNGSFLMGNNGSESYSYSNELPQHQVTLSAYSIGKYEVTRGQYLQFINAGGYSYPHCWSALGLDWLEDHPRTQPNCWAEHQDWHSDGGFDQTNDYPVVGLTYHEAEAFCNWAGVTLPTEAQWEKAARWDGASPRVYPWGSVWDKEKCNNNDDSLYTPGTKYRTVEVGSYPAVVSYYGCLDMAGNVTEWCKDWYGSSYYSTPPTGGWIDPQGPATSSSRVLRGGDWSMPQDGMRCAYRYHYAPGYENNRFGFRVVRQP